MVQIAIYIHLNIDNPIYIHMFLTTLLALENDRFNDCSNGSCLAKEFPAWAFKISFPPMQIFDESFFTVQEAIRPPGGDLMLALVGRVYRADIIIYSE